MRFLFRGLTRNTGASVEGHVEASDREAAYSILGQNGIVTEILREDPKPLDLSANESPIPEFSNALESALDSSSQQVAFDDLTERYRGKKVWVIDRDKIKHRVAQVVDSTLASSETDLESNMTARQRVANAISGLFHDNRNIASEHTAESIAAMKLAAAAANINASPGMNPGALAQQIGRLTDVVQQAETMIAAMATALQRVQQGVGPAPIRHRMQVAAPSMNLEQNSVLQEIFKSNMELRKTMAQSESPAIRAMAG